MSELWFPFVANLDIIFSKTYDVGKKGNHQHLLKILAQMHFIYILILKYYQRWNLFYRMLSNDDIKIGTYDSSMILYHFWGKLCMYYPLLLISTSTRTMHLNSNYHAILFSLPMKFYKKLASYFLLPSVSHLYEFTWSYKKTFNKCCPCIIYFVKITWTTRCHKWWLKRFRFLIVDYIFAPIWCGFYAPLFTR